MTRAEIMKDRVAPCPFHEEQDVDLTCDGSYWQVVCGHCSACGPLRKTAKTAAQNWLAMVSNMEWEKKI